MKPLIFLDDSVIVTSKIAFIRNVRECFSKHGKYSIEINFIGCSKKEIMFENKDNASLKLKEILYHIENYAEINGMFIPLKSILCIFNTRNRSGKFYFGILIPMKHYIDFTFDSEKESENRRKNLLDSMREYYEQVYTTK